MREVESHASSVWQCVRHAFCGAADPPRNWRGDRPIDDLRAGTRSAGAGTPPDSPARAVRRTLAGILMMVSSAGSNQFGAAVGATAFDAIGPLGVVAVRQIVGRGGADADGAARRCIASRRAQWWPVLLLGVVFVAMNLSLYTAVDRIGLGLAVTLEFLGPLAVALASSRRPLDLVCAVAAFGGVWVLVLPGPSSDLLGIGSGLIAAGVLGRRTSCSTGRSAGAPSGCRAPRHPRSSPR